MRTRKTTITAYCPRCGTQLTTECEIDDRYPHHTVKFRDACNMLVSVTVDTKSGVVAEVRAKDVTEIERESLARQFEWLAPYTESEGC